jgi:uncharacterized protein (TIGR03435 family)
MKNATFAALLFTATYLYAQASAPPAKTPAFDVVSIRPSGLELTQGGAWGVSQNKYSAKNTPLAPIILQAWLGQKSVPGERLKNAPSWVMTEPYDITAKVDDATADSWKGMHQAQQVAIVAPMLRATLEDRCKLVAHTVPTEVQGYALVLGKRPLKIKEAKPDEPLPANFVKFESGWMWVKPAPDATSVTYLQITMADLVDFLSVGGMPIVDQTGLTGKYDMKLPKVDTSPLEAGENAAPAPRLDTKWEAIGLEMKPIKVPALDLVIDHIERPTAN